MNSKEKTIQEKIKSTIETYNKYSSIYAEYTKQKLLQFQLSKFVSLIPKNGKVLDAGCGCGRDASYLKEDGIEVSAVDICEGMIKEAKKVGVNAIKGDLLRMKANEEFDGIWCMATMADIPKSEASKVIKNFYSALKKEGILYIAVKKGEGEHIIEKERYGKMPRFYALYKQDEINKLLEENKFNIIESVESNDESTEWIEVFAKKQ